MGKLRIGLQRFIFPLIVVGLLVTGCASSTENLQREMARGVGRSSSIRSPACCAAYQRTDVLPDQPPQGVIRLAIGGDARDDLSHVVPWAFQEAKKRGATAFFFLGDMEIARELDTPVFKPKLEYLGGVPFYPLMGNHEVELFGAIRLPDSPHVVHKFKENFLTAPRVHLAAIPDVVAYSVEVGDAIHFIALDNVSRKHEGFGAEQLNWLRSELSAARAAGKVILVGMHKALAHNQVTRHAMDEDGRQAISDSDDALDLFKTYRVAMVFVSHSHMYAAFTQEGIDVRLTGGLGAPLVKGLKEADGGFHHFLLVDVALGANPTPLQVEVVKFHGTPTRDDKDEADEVEAHAK